MKLDFLIIFLYLAFSEKKNEMSVRRIFSIALLLLVTSACVPLRERHLALPRVSWSDDFVTHTYYALTYSEEHELPEWTAYTLSREKTFPVVDRSYSYRPDPLVETKTADSDDYNRSGYDRGHLVPARDMAFDSIAQAEVNYMSNITPQDRGFNRGIWRTLEAKVRKWAVVWDSVMIVSGPILEAGLDSIGKENNISVPRKFFKALLVHTDTCTSAIAFVIPNEKQTGRDHMEFAVSIDSLEILTGINFFHRLPRKIEKETEAEFDPEFWKLQ